MDYITLKRGKPKWNVTPRQIIICVHHGRIPVL